MAAAGEAAAEAEAGETMEKLRPRLESSWWLWVMCRRCWCGQCKNCNIL